MTDHSKYVFRFRSWVFWNNWTYEFLEKLRKICGRVYLCKFNFCFYVYIVIHKHWVDTKTKCRHLKNWPLKGLWGRCLSELIDRRYSQSCWYFWPSFVNCCPSNLLSGSTIPPPFLCVNKYTVHTYKVFKGGEEVWGSGPHTDNSCRKVPLHVNFFRWRHFALPSMWGLSFYG